MTMHDYYGSSGHWRSTIQKLLCRTWKSAGARVLTWLSLVINIFMKIFLYQTEWLGLCKSGLLLIGCASLEIKQEKIYVTTTEFVKNHRNMELAKEGATYILWWCDNIGAGPSTKLIELISQQGNKSRDDATEYLRHWSRGHATTWWYDWILILPERTNQTRQSLLVQRLTKGG